MFRYDSLNDHCGKLQTFNQSGRTIHAYLGTGAVGERAEKSSVQVKKKPLICVFAVGISQGCCGMAVIKISQTGKKNISDLGLL